MLKIVSWSALLCATLATVAGAQDDPSWTEPFAPFRLAGNLFFVGTRGISSYLLTTPDGHILIDTGLEQTVAQIRANVENHTMGQKDSFYGIVNNTKYGFLSFAVFSSG
jgi:metallo-beta-lactamase class B